MSTALAALREDETRIMQTLTEGAAGVLVSKALAQAMDRFLIAHAQAVPPPAFPIALVATGGQGRLERSPKSDVDLAIVHQGGDQQELQRYCDALLYPLWDAKLDLGHSVRTVKQTVDVFAKDEATLTSHLDARLLMGSSDLFEQLRAESSRAFERRGALYVEALLKPIEDRARAETLVFVLEPNLKNGPGGLRDIHQIEWVLRFSKENVLRQRERMQLLAARSFYMRARAFLHDIAKRRQDQITFELQRDLAERIYPHGSPKDSVEQLLGRHYVHAQAVIDTKHRVFMRLAEAKRGRPRKKSRKDGFVLWGGRLGLESRDHFEKHPKDILRIMLVALEEKLMLTDMTLDALAAAAPKIRVLRNDQELAAYFWQIIDHPRGADALVDLHQCGVLERYLPEFGRTRGMVQADFYHAYTVDVHSLNVVTLLYALRRGEGLKEFADVAKGEPSFRSLVMGALFHDAGKRSGQDHAVFGTTLVEAAMARLHAPQEDIADASFLVREHLTLMKISQRRDISDPELIASVAETVGSVARLQRLYVLSYVDTAGTGPTLWTPWKGALLTELYQRTKAHLQGAQYSQAELQQFAEMQAAGGGVKLGDEVHGHRSLVVVARDKPGLLALVAGLCAEARLSVASAELFSSPEGWALDRFMIRFDAPRGMLADEARKQSDRRMQDVAKKIIDGATPKPPTPARPSHALAPDVRIVENNQIIDVSAPDRPGLLHALAEAIHASGYTITVARITTEGARAIDAFYVKVAREGARPMPELLTMLEAISRW